MEGFVFAVIMLIVLVVGFFLTREFWCWYFKFNEISGKLSQIVVLLGGKEEVVEETRESAITVEWKTPPNDEICPVCGEKPLKVKELNGIIYYMHLVSGNALVHKAEGISVKISKGA